MFTRRIDSRRAGRQSRRLAMVAAAAAAVVGLGVLGTPAGAAGVSYTDQITGTEVWFWPATFVGAAGGSLPGTFRTVVEHTKLPNSVGGTATVTGGTFALTTRFDGKPVQLSGQIADDGRISYRNLAPGLCGDQTFEVTGTLANVNLGVGGGRFDVTLVHHRASVLGYCLVYGAAQTGSLTLTH